MMNITDNNEKNGIKRWFLRIATTVIVLLLMVTSFAGGLLMAGRNEVIRDLAREEAVYLGSLTGKYSLPDEGVITQDVDFNLFWDIWDSLEEKFVDRDRLNEKMMFYGAIKGMVSSLGDPYTVFMDPKIAHDFEEDMAGKFEGIGAEIGIKNEILTIIAPLPDMPAEKAGLKAGDKVLAIDGETTAGVSIDEAVSRIRGPKGTEVILTITRPSLEKAEDITIIRDTIRVKSVRTESREDGIFVIKISNFNDDTEPSFNDAVKEAVTSDPRGIILDLRNNPGGYLDTAIEVASEWVEDGVIVTEKYTDNNATPHLARGRARLAGYRTVVLVNQGSASASEIVAGALRDYGLAVVVGMQTFGKGSVQTLDQFPDGSSIKITVAKWLTPDGTSINDEGISPDVEVDLTLDDYNENNDPQLDQAVELLTGEENEERTRDQ